MRNPCYPVRYQDMVGRDSLSFVVFVVKANFPLGRKDLNVSTYQMCMLMLFNSRATLSFNGTKNLYSLVGIGLHWFAFHLYYVCVVNKLEIKAVSRIPEPEIRRHLLSLCTHKIRILKKSSKGKVF